MKKLRTILTKNFWAIVLLCSIIFLIILFAGIIDTPRYEPDEGLWFCEELQIQLDYNDASNTFMIENGTKVRCVQGSERGSKAIYVSCQQQNHPDYKLGELVFYADIVELTDKTLTLFDPLTEREYTFVRVDVDPSAD